MRSPREREALQSLARGYRYERIAEALFIIPEMVRSHLRKVYDKLHLRSRTEVAVKFMGAGRRRPPVVQARPLGSLRAPHLPPPVYRLTPDLVLYAYRQGLFPMADPDDGDRIYWYAPDPRAVLPLDRFHVPRSLTRLVRQDRYRVTTDEAFEAVIRACALPAQGRPSTWISEDIAEVFTRLHRRGFAHSVECWDDTGEEGPVLAGGLYGVALGGAFFGESMFHRRRDASKVALVHLVRRLRAGGFVLLDTQFSTPHLARFGVVEIPRDAYEVALDNALRLTADWRALDAGTVKVG